MHWFFSRATFLGMSKNVYSVVMTNNIKETWQGKAKRLLRQRRIYHDEIAGLLGLKKATISQKLNGKIGTEMSEMIIIAKRLGMTVDQLLVDDPVYSGEQSKSVRFMQEYADLSEVQQEMILKLIKTIQD